MELSYFNLCLVFQCGDLTETYQVTTVLWSQRILFKIKGATIEHLNISGSSSIIDAISVLSQIIIYAACMKQLFTDSTQIAEINH